jgi:hypothetical protein
VSVKQMRHDYSDDDDNSGEFRCLWTKSKAGDCMAPCHCIQHASGRVSERRYNLPMVYTHFNIPNIVINAIICSCFDMNVNNKFRRYILRSVQ